MRILIWAFVVISFISAEANGAESLRFELRVPEGCVSLADGIEISAIVHNQSNHWMWILPNFTPSQSGLNLTYVCSEEERVVGDLVTEDPTEEKYYSYLKPGAFIGANFEISHHAGDAYFYPLAGLKEGTCSVTASLKVLVRIEDAVRKMELISPPKSLCVGEASQRDIERNLEFLKSKNDELDVLDAIRFFSTARDVRAIPLLEALQKDPEAEIHHDFIGWALKRQKATG